MFVLIQVMFVIFLIKGILEWFVIMILIFLINVWRVLIFLVKILLVDVDQMKWVMLVMLLWIVVNFLFDCENKIILGYCVMNLWCFIDIFVLVCVYQFVDKRLQVVLFLNLYLQFKVLVVSCFLQFFVIIGIFVFMIKLIVVDVFL